MLASELIAHLQSQIAEHGDLPVYRAADHGANPIPFTGKYTHTAAPEYEGEGCQEDGGEPYPPRYLMVY